MDNSSANTTSPLECSNSYTEPSVVHWTKTVVYLMLLTLALFGNALVIWIVYKYKSMRTASNFLIVNVAFGDLLMAIFGMMPTAISMLREAHSWVNDGPSGNISCKFFLFSQGVSMACSVFSLTALAFERFFAVVHPMQKLVTTKRTRWLIALIWIASFASISPTLYAAKVQLFEGVPYCIEDWAPAFDSKSARRIFTVVTFFLLYVLPLVVITVLYSIIAAKVWGRRTPGTATQVNRRASNKVKKNVLRMSMAVVLAFALGWLLMHLNLLLMDFSNIFKPCGIPFWLQTTGFFLGHANSAFNCCIYALFCQNYRRGFKEAFKLLSSICLRDELAPVPGIPLEERDRVVVVD